ncbi:MAG: LON peptidase substrate-binding domain-containing protein [Alphaproteobacteria bacterium]
MRDFRDAKAMAQTLRSTLTPKGLTLSHTESLEVMARVLGAKDWNVLSALIESSRHAARPESRPAAEQWSGPLIPSRDFVLFPKMTAPVFIGRETSKQAVLEAGRGGFEVFLIAQKNSTDDSPSRDAVYDVGVIADVIETIEVPPNERGGTYKLMLHGRQRARLIDIGEDDGRLKAQVEPIREPDQAGQAAEQVSSAIEAFRAFSRLVSDATIKNLSTPNWFALMRLDLAEVARLIARVEKITQPGALADVIALYSPGTVPDKQDVLETLDPLVRLEKSVALLSKQTA